MRHSSNSRPPYAIGPDGPAGHDSSRAPVQHLRPTPDFLPGRPAHGQSGARPRSAQRFFPEVLKAIWGAVDDEPVGALQQFPWPNTSSDKKLTPSLGSLLHDHRAAAGETAKTVSRRSELGPVEIAQLELSRADLSAEQYADAVAAYAVPRRVFPEGRCRVHVDLAAGSVSVDIGETMIEETPADRIVLTYFELVYAPSADAPAMPIPFTTLDLDVLRVILSSRRDEVTEHLHRIVGPMDEPTEPAEAAAPEAPAAPRNLRGALLLLAAAATALAGVIAIRDAASSHTPAGPPIEVHIIDALVVTRENPN